MESEKAIIFCKPEQIGEILGEAERLKLQVLVRYTNDGKAVRAHIEHTDLKNDKGVRLAGISPAGDHVLANYAVVKVEFVLLSKKIYFVTRIRARTTSRLLLAAPDKLFAVERRRNARFAVPRGLSAYVEFWEKSVDITRYDAPLRPEITSRARLMVPRFRIDDVSLGGAALFTRFSALAEAVKPEPDEVMAHFFFPKTPPIVVPVSIRWTKKSTVALISGKHEHLRRILTAKLVPLGLRPNDIEFNEVFHRIGIQFSEVSKELDTVLRDFIRVVQTAESV